MNLEHLKEKCNIALEFAEKQLHDLIEKHPNFFPMYTMNGKWKHDHETWTNWCEGLLGGQMWILFQNNQDNWWFEQAKHYSRLIENRKTDRVDSRRLHNYL